ncbi:MAG: YaeQ family protein [Gammaproteobacteria bacterium]|nr:YaeQ family protein [Gammaproteobacteria bacterium]
MALKPTIHKFNISLSDLNRDYYDSLNLTVAQHPSETTERMMSRILAFCLNAQEALVFTKGLSDPDLPDIWKHTLDDQLALWIDLGEPAVDRIKKASRVAAEVKVYSFNSKSDVWWAQNKTKFAMLKATVIQFNHLEIQALAKLAERTVTCSITITGDSAYIATETGECEINWVNLQR